MKKKLLLVDGNSLIFRAYFASIYSGATMSTSDGTPTNAVYSFINMLTSIMNKDEYYDVKVAFDKGKKTFRHEKLSDYKAGRSITPPDLIVQFAIVREYLDSAGIDYFEMDNYEADDLIGTMVKIAEETDEYDIVVFTSDQDMYQLISDKTVVLAPQNRNPEPKIYDAEQLYEKWEIEPRQVVDYKGLSGDSSDNIKGVAGIGPKTAKELLHQYDTIEGIYEHINEIKGAKQIKLIEGKESAFLSKEIATIKTDVDMKGLEFRKLEINYDSFKEFLVKYQMNSIIKKYTDNYTKPEIEKFEYKIINKWSPNYSAKKNYIYLETIDDNYHNSKVAGFAICNEKGNFYYDVDTNKEMNLFNWQDDQTDEELISFLSKPDIEFLTYDVKKTIYGFKTLGYSIEPSKFTYDMMIAVYILNNNIKSQFEKHALYIDSGIVLPSIEEVFGKGVKKTPFIDLSVKSEYIARKAMIIKKLESEIKTKLIENKQLSLYEEIEFPFMFVLLNMEQNGVSIDREELKIQTDSILEVVTKLENEIKDMVKDYIEEDFNVASPKQLKELLFEKLKLKDFNKGSTDKETLDLLMDLHPVVEKISKFRKFQKLYSTYLKGFEKFIASDNKVHTIFNQTLTNTGRLSSSDPNLQNISIRDEEQRNVRKIFITKPGYTFISYDYSQIELRVLADIANEKHLLEIFAKGGDVHTESARKIFNLDSEAEVDSEMRRTAKVFNFGIIYGLSDFGLSKDLKISIPEAKNFIAQYFKSFPGILEFKNEMIAFAKENYFVETIGHRRRYIHELKNPNHMVKQFGERIAVNMPIQGTAADILKVAMINIYNELSKDNLDAKIVAQIHDEIILEVKENDVKKTQEVVKKQMKKAYDDLLKISGFDRDSKVNLEISEAIGENWFKLK